MEENLVTTKNFNSKRMKPVIVLRLNCQRGKLIKPISMWIFVKKKKKSYRWNYIIVVELWLRACILWILFLFFHYIDYSKAIRWFDRYQFHQIDKVTFCSKTSPEHSLKNHMTCSIIWIALSVNYKNHIWFELKFYLS